jgi:hypothetical protein
MRPFLSKTLVPLLVVSAASAEISPAVSTGRNPVLVELFTSEGCSSCPPADEALVQLEAKQPVPGAQVIALEWHVDYWNRLGWADPYSSAEATARQESYSEAFRLDGVYTPQVVIDGRKQLVGGSADVGKEISDAARGTKARIQLSLTGRDANSVQIRAQMGERPAVAANDRAELWLAITEGNLQTEVLRGENAGRRLKHSAVVRRLKRVATVLQGAKEPPAAEWNEELDPSWVRSQLRATAFLQEVRSRRVLAAATLSLAAP